MRIIEDGEEPTEINEDLLNAITTMASSIKGKSDISSRLVTELKKISISNTEITNVITALLSKIEGKNSSSAQIEKYCNVVTNMMNSYCGSVNSMMKEVVKIGEKPSPKQTKKKFEMVPNYGPDKRITTIKIVEL